MFIGIMSPMRVKKMPDFASLFFLFSSNSVLLLCPDRASAPNGSGQRQDSYPNSLGGCLSTRSSCNVSLLFTFYLCWLVLELNLHWISDRCSKHTVNNTRLLSTLATDGGEIGEAWEDQTDIPGSAVLLILPPAQGWSRDGSVPHSIPCGNQIYISHLFFLKQ